MSLYKRIPLIAKLIIAVTLGIILGSTLPTSIIRVFVTFSSIFSAFLGFTIPLIIVSAKYQTTLVNYLDYQQGLLIFLQLSQEHSHSYQLKQYYQVY